MEESGHCSGAIPAFCRCPISHEINEMHIPENAEEKEQNKEGMTCCDDDGVVGDLIWRLKNVLREFIPEEKHNITKEYYFPLSKGLLKYSISVPARMRPSLPPSRSDFGFTYRIHPVVVANIFVHRTRVKDQDACCGDNSSSGATAAQPPRVFGCVIGVQRWQTVEICNSFELVVDPVSGTIDRASFEKQQELCNKLILRAMHFHDKKLFADLNVKGWYSTGSDVQDNDMKIQRMLLDVDHHPVYLLLNPATNPSKMDLPVTIYGSWFDFGYTSVMHVCNFCESELLYELPKSNTQHLIEFLWVHIREATNCKRWAFRRMLLETPSGFAMFGIDDKVFSCSEAFNILMCCSPSYMQVIFTIGFIKVDNKSVAWDSDAGPGEDLGHFILKFCNRKGLIVQDLQLKKVIETKLIDREFISMIGRLKYLEYTSDAIFKFLHDRFDHCFPGTGMSEIEYAKATANLLSSEPSVVMHDDMYSKEDILRTIDILLAAPKKIRHVWSCLRLMEAAHLQETASDVDSGNDEKQKLGGAGFVRRPPWSTVVGFGCFIAMEWFVAERFEATRLK
ncbi:COP9 signalosome complex subunit 6b [Dichanthelium oligosanthes]|uniref:COP9 signalosome complex subunit 6b n=1 Tax=Dichanthelium oligosanthes TaxID=888268 RepID=A0A1E5VBW8_9POAL|nr:COP9 signalosome complex subunit 6b [Dichanthelium oligosanthes]